LFLAVFNVATSIFSNCTRRFAAALQPITSFQYYTIKINKKQQQNKKIPTARNTLCYVFWAVGICYVGAGHCIVIQVSLLWFHPAWSSAADGRTAP